MTFQNTESFESENPGEPAMILKVCGRHDFSSRDIAMPCPDCYFEYVRDFHHGLANSE